MNNILANTQTAKYVSDVFIYKINFSNGITIKIYFFFLITQITTLFKKKRKKKDNHSLLTPLLREFQSSIPFQSLSTCTSCPQYKKKKKKKIYCTEKECYL